MKSNMNTILVIGGTGNGKSTLCDYILGCPKSQCEGHTKVISRGGHASYKNKDIFMIDTSGLSDGCEEDPRIIDRIRKDLKANHCHGIKSIILVQNLNLCRISLEDRALLAIYAKMFQNPEFWYHVGIVFSNSYEYFPDKVLDKMKKEKKMFF